MKTIAISLHDANNFVRKHHRHLYPVVGHKFSFGVEKKGEMIGVCIVGRPVNRHVDDGKTLEVLRLCVPDGHKNACSFLYGKARQAAFAIGYERIGTYVLESETGSTLKAAGFRMVRETEGGLWVRTRPQIQYPLYAMRGKDAYIEGAKRYYCSERGL